MSFLNSYNDSTRKFIWILERSQEQVRSVLLTKFSLASTAIEIGNLSMGENLIMVSA